MTGTELAASAREALYGDVDAANLRISDAELLIWINDAQAELYRINPACAYVTAITVTKPADIIALSDTLPINDIYRASIVDYLVYRFYSKDTQDEENRVRAGMYFKLFLGKSGSNG